MASFLAHLLSLCAETGGLADAARVPLITALACFTAAGGIPWLIWSAADAG